MLHGDGFAFFGGKKGGIHGNGTDISSGGLEFAKFRIIQFPSWGFFGKDSLPYFGTGCCIGIGEFDDKPDAA